MRTDGQTDMTKLIVAFRNFANAPKSKLCEEHVHPSTDRDLKWMIVKESISISLTSFVTNFLFLTVSK